MSILHKIMSKVKREYLLSYISEYILSIFVFCFIFIQLVFLPRRPSKGVAVLLLLLILISFVIRMVSFALHKYNKTYVRDYFQHTRENHWRTFTIQVIISLLISIGLRFLL